MAELTRKERVAIKRQSKVLEYQLVLTHAYEMWRSWNCKPEHASNKAKRETEKYIYQQMKRIPQEKSFFMDCAIEFRNSQDKLLQEIEKDRTGG